MKVAVTITSRGVITLPAKIRRAFGLEADAVLIAETTADGILLRPAVTMPVEIYTEDRLVEFDEGETELADWFARKPRAGESSAARKSRKR